MSDGYSTWLEIDLAAIRNNVHQLREINQTPIMAVVKANGYGHGAVETAKAAIEAGAEWCGVARFEEAVALRNAGLDCRLLVMGYTPPACLPEAIAGKISLTIYDTEIGKILHPPAGRTRGNAQSACQGGYRHGTPGSKSSGGGRDG